MGSLEPLFDDLDEIGRTAVAKYRRYPAEFLIDHDNRAAAANIYSHMAMEADRRLLGRPGISQLDVRGLKIWLIGDEIVLRFKKMNSGGTYRRYPTQQARDFDAQGDLPGVPVPATRLAVGYLLNSTGTDVRRIQIARPISRGRISWCAAIVPAAEHQAGQLRWYEVTGQQQLTA